MLAAKLIISWTTWLRKSALQTHCSCHEQGPLVTCRHAEQPLYKHQWMIVDYIKSQLPSGSRDAV